jgi:hypothetical protein
MEIIHLEHWDNPEGRGAVRPQSGKLTGLIDGFHCVGNNCDCDCDVYSLEVFLLSTTALLLPLAGGILTAAVMHRYRYRYLEEFWHGRLDTQVQIIFSRRTIICCSWVLREILFP